MGANRAQGTDNGISEAKVCVTLRPTGFCEDRDDSKQTLGASGTSGGCPRVVRVTPLTLRLDIVSNVTGSRYGCNNYLWRLARRRRLTTTEVPSDLNLSICSLALE